MKENNGGNMGTVSAARSNGHPASSITEWSPACSHVARLRLPH